MKKFASVFCLAMLVSLAFTANAAVVVTVNGTAVSSNSSGGEGATAWTCSSAMNLALSGAGPYVLSGNNNDDVFGITAGADCTVVASNLTVTSYTTSVCPFDCNGHTVTLCLYGTTKFSSRGKAALRVASNDTACASLVITNLTTTAKLLVSSSTNFKSAGIGGDTGESCGTIVIWGGQVTATGGDYGAGIGGGSGGAGGWVTVNGGTVSATGGFYSTGIGGGRNGQGGVLTVNGGTVTAIGKDYAAGIGGAGNGGSGVAGDGGVVTINGGTVTATGGNYGAGIGGGFSSSGGGSGGVCTITGGTVVANGGRYGAGIGGGSKGRAGTIWISGGTVSATGGERGAGIGHGPNCEADGTITISGGLVTATGGAYAAGIGGGYYGFGCTLAVSGGTLFASGDSSSDTQDIGQGYVSSTQSGISKSNTFTGGSIHAVRGNIALAPSNGAVRVWCVTVPGLVGNTRYAVSGLPAGYGVNDLVSDADGNLYFWLPDGNYRIRVGEQDYLATVAGAGMEAEERAIGVKVNGEDAIRLSGGAGATAWSLDGGTNLILSGAGPYVLSGSNIAKASLTNALTIHATYLGAMAVTFSNLTVAATGPAFATAFRSNRIAITLVGTNTFLGGGTGNAGIELGGYDTTINAASEADTLYAAGAYAGSRFGLGGAGIGAGASGIWNFARTVVILGGTITAVGGGRGASGIGGAFNSPSTDDNLSGGKVIVSNGVVNAIGSGYGAGIGGTAMPTIPKTYDPGSVIIAGGVVTATGGNNGAGIGASNDSTGGKLAVYGGTLFATGAQSCYDVGGGTNRTSGANTFTGGAVYLANGTILNAPSNATDRVYRLVIPGFAPDSSPVFSGLPASYGTNDLRTDSSGNLCLWLPDGDYSIRHDDMVFAATIAGADAVAERQLVGVAVDGRDIILDSGEGWTFAGGILNLSATNASYVISGSNGTNNIAIRALVDCSVLASNLTVNVSSFSGVTALNCDGHAVNLALFGTNVFASGYRRPGIITTGSTLVLTNRSADASLASAGGAGAAGIGGAYKGAGGTVIVRGGIITATGGNTGAGIGGGDYGAGGAVTISGGIVTATAGRWAAGIGGGRGGAGGTCAVVGGTVVASCRYGTTSTPGVDIGYGCDVTVSGANTFTGGSVHPSTDGTIVLAPSNGAARVWCVTVTGLVANARCVVSGLPGDYGVDGLYADASGCLYLWLPNGTYRFAVSGQSFEAIVADAPAFVIWRVGVSVNGIDLSAGSGGNGVTAWTYVDRTNLVFSGAGPYVVSGSNGVNAVSIRAATDCEVVASNLTLDVSTFWATNVTGIASLDCAAHAVTLRLFGLNMFMAGIECAGIAVVSNQTSWGSLSIKGEVSDRDVLAVTGGSAGAGIGGGMNEAAGRITFAGGCNVVAYGGTYGAGIGGGFQANGGVVTISGGRVYAIGGDYGAGIGGGSNGKGADCVVSGGYATAEGGELAAGIGGGYLGNGGTTAISGGTIAAAKGSTETPNDAQDIGHGAGATSCGANIFTGGNILMRNGEDPSPAPSNGAVRVWCVTNVCDVAGLNRESFVKAILSGLPADYGTNDLFPASDGTICLWLPPGDYAASVSATDGTMTNTVLKVFEISSSGTVDGPRDETLRITRIGDSGITVWFPSALDPAYVETLYSTNLTAASGWKGTNDFERIEDFAAFTNAPAVFLKLRVK